MIEPVVERLAEEKGRGGQKGRGVAFAKVEIRVGMGSVLASQYGIRATPTFVFFLDGEKVCGFVCCCSCGEVADYGDFSDKRVERRRCARVAESG
jgi:thioredoxin-like negative regulator of GroEL